MIKYFKVFFYPEFLTYSYNLSKESVIEKIVEIFKKPATLFTSNDMNGRFLKSNTFSINALSFGSAQGIGATLVGQITESQNGVTEIKTKAKPSIVLYLLFFLTIFFGFAYLYQFIQSGSTEFLLWSLGILIIGPALSIGVSNVTIYSIRERYTMYIDKELNKSNVVVR